MEQCSPFGMIYMTEEEIMMGEVRQYMVQTRMEMETTVIAAQEEILKKDEELNHMKELLMLTIKERDEAQFKIQKLMLEKLLIQQLLQQQQQQLLQQQRQQQQQKRKSNSVSKTNTTTNCFSASSSESSESSIIASSSPSVGPNSPPTPIQNTTTMVSPSSAQLPPQVLELLSSRGRPLPEKGRLLKAVMEAGPLLQTLLLAGPLPQWQHPPPKLNSIEIPPVSINTNPFNSHGKRGIESVDEAIISSPKYQRIG